MKTIINQNRFAKALEYVSENYFSKPYSLSPIFDRWFNQLAMIELANGELLHLSDKLALEYVDILLDGECVSREVLKLISTFHSRKANYESDRISLKKQIELLESGDDKSPANMADLDKLKHDLVQFDKDRLRAKERYDAIVARGRPVLNEERLVEKYKSNIQNIVYRPNHGLTHSARAAYSITNLHVYRQEHGLASEALTELELEKLQVMMLFSVTGRKDETGFADTGDCETGNISYSEYRTTSGREYLRYSREHLGLFYNDNLESLYRDAIIVELMGYDSIQDAIDRKKIPELFVDYCLEKERLVNPSLSREEVIALISSGSKKRQYSLSKFFPVGQKSARTRADAMLDMMNEAHCLDLIRCYSLYPSKKDGAMSVSVLTSHLDQAGFLSSPSIEKLSSFFKLMRCSFDTMVLTGQKTTFGMLSNAEFEQQKDQLFQELSSIFNDFANKDRRDVLLIEARAARDKEPPEGYFSSNAKKDQQLLNDYRDYKIVHCIAECLKKGETLKFNKRTFAFTVPVGGDPHVVNHHQSAINLVKALQTVEPLHGLAARPLISSVKHNRELNLANLLFDEKSQAQHFQDFYQSLYNIIPEIKVDSQGKFILEVDRNHYRQLLRDKCVEFKLVTIPKKVEREASLVDDKGQIDALSLINNNRALVRLVSTTALGSEQGPDYNYLLRALDDPMHQRYVRPDQEFDKFPIKAGQYRDPRNAKIYDRIVLNSEGPDLRFQEPITEAVKFEDKIKDDWFVGKGQIKSKNTIYTKKMAHSLVPANGLMIPFEGYAQTRSKYFPIGVLSDIESVNLKDGRYIWSKNMNTASRFWIRDPVNVHPQMYALLNAQLNSNGGIERYDSKFPKLNKAFVKMLTSKDAVLNYLEKQSEALNTLLSKKQYHPSEDILNEFKKLLAQQYKIIRKLDLSRPFDLEYQNKIKKFYSTTQKLLSDEIKGKSDKKAISLESLIKEQNMNKSVGKHNEILASNTKSATRALFSPKDNLFSRLNLALHAMQIKKQYGYDVPLLILSAEHPPYHYTEERIKADLIEAYKHIRASSFPYDTSMSDAYELDKDGRVFLDAKGRPISKKDSEGNVIQIPKDLDYQKAVLLDLFKLGIPDLSSLDDLVNAEVLSDDKLNISLLNILDHMDVLGGLQREMRLMEKVFAGQDIVEREQSLLRAAALGHQPIVEVILAKKDFKLNPDVLERAIAFAGKNHHLHLNDFLSNYLPAKEQSQLAQELHSAEQEEIVEQLDASALIKANLEIVVEPAVEAVNLQIQQLEQVKPDLFKVCVDSLFKLNENFLGNKDIEVFIAKTVQDIYRNENNEEALALIKQRIEDDNLAICIISLAEIQKASLGHEDRFMEEFILENKRKLNDASLDPKSLAEIRVKLTQMHDIVTSPEMKAVKAQIQKLENKDKSFFGWNIGIRGLSFGAQKKADKIKQVIYSIPLEERADLFTKNKDLRKALAANRILGSGAPLDIEGEVQAKLKPANSFIEVSKSIAATRKLKERIGEIVKPEDNMHEEKMKPPQN